MTQRPAQPGAVPPTPQRSQLHKRVATTSPARPRAASATRLIGVLVVVLYLAVMVAGWIGNLPAGHEGIVSIEPSTTVPQGAIIREVAAGSPVDRAGLGPGDVILSVNGVAADDGDGIHQIQHDRRAGDRMMLRVQRATGDGGRPAYGPAEDVEIVLDSQLAIPSIVIENLIASVVGLLIVVVAVIVAESRPRDLAARLLLIFGGCFAFVVAMGMLHWGLQLAWLAQAADAASAGMMVLGCASLFHLFLAFPVPHPLLTRLAALGPTSLRHIGGGTALLYIVPLAVPLAAATGLVEWTWVLLDFIALLVGALLALVRSYRHAPTPLAHAQLKWITWALMIFVVALLLGLIVPGTTGGRVQVLPPGALTAALGLFPIAIGFAILRYRLWEIDILINRTLVYGAVTGLLVAIYLVSVVLLQGLFRALTGQESNLAVVVSTLASVALFQPLQHRLQAFIDRRFYRRKYDAVRTLAAFSARLRDEVDLTTLTEELVAVVDETMQPSHVSLWLRPRTGGPIRAPRE